MLDFDVLDSDDDAFLAEISNSLPDSNMLCSESSQILEKCSSPHHNSQNICSNRHNNQENIVLNNENTLDKRKNSSDVCRISKDVKTISSRCNNISSGINKNDLTLKYSPSIDNTKTINNTIFKSDCNAFNLSKITFTYENSDVFNKQVNAAVSSSSELESNVTVSFLNATPKTSSYIDSRFTPGFIPKPRKRKFAGPAGLLEFSEESNVEKLVGSNKTSDILGFEPASSSQISTDYLALSSWQKLQADVFSHPNLHFAKFYSIQRILCESFKAKLPKHMVVPVLCVVVKKMQKEGSPTISVFMDDTGEIDGKINADVISMYKECLIEGSALILKKITFLFNMLMLKPNNLISIYMPNGSEIQVQSLKSITDTSEPQKSLNCECFKQSHFKKSNFSSTSYDSSTIDYHKTNCVGHGQSISDHRKRFNVESLLPLKKSLIPMASYEKTTPNYQDTDCVSHKNIAHGDSSKINTANIGISSASSSSLNKISTQGRYMRNDNFLKDLVSENNDLDEFDELLGNLDEKSFLDGATDTSMLTVRKQQITT